jgi:glycine/D-amino acid oxidase-like deaminating enzyme
MDLRTGCAFWVLKNGLLFTYPRLTHDIVADVVVIGAGVTGALVTYELTKAGANVVVLDRRDVASGSTAASTGLLQYETDTSLEELAERFGIESAVRVYRLGIEAIDRIAQICDEVGDSCGFARRSTLYLAASKRDAQALAREHALRVAHGFDVDLLPAAEVKARFGLSAHGALFGPGDGEIDSYRFTHFVLTHAARAGARVFDRTTVKRVRPHADGVDVLMTTGPRIRAKHVIYTTGYEAVEHTKIPTKLTSTFACATEPVDSFAWWEGRCLIWETSRPYLYLRTTADNRVMAGGEDSPFSSRHERSRVLEAKRDRLMTRLRRMVPQLNPEPAYVWGGVFAETRDGLPFIGRRTDEERASYALGYGANGITSAMLAATLLRDAYLGRPNADAALFSFDRTRRRE